MPRLIWSPRALGDVSRLHHFLHRKNPGAARRAVGAIRAGVRILERHPAAGKHSATMPDEFREWPIEFGRDGYLVLYRLDTDLVTIVAIRHFREAGY